jgi:DNA-binding CsgD family transcriptional regulator
VDAQVLTSLTTREQQVMSHAIAGHTSATIGRELGISEHTVRKHLEHVYRKFGVRNRAGAVAFVLTSDVELRDGRGSALAPGIRITRSEQARRLREEAEALRGQAQHQRRRAKANSAHANRLIDRARKLET